MQHVRDRQFTALVSRNCTIKMKDITINTFVDKEGYCSLAKYNFSSDHTPKDFLHVYIYFDYIHLVAKHLKQIL
jgi:hypothetical protein